MKRYKVVGLLTLLLFLFNYEKAQNETILNTHITKTLKFHHYNLTDFSFIHSSDWHFSIHKKNNNIYKVLNNLIPVNFHFVTGDLVDSKSKDNVVSHQYPYEEDQVSKIIRSYTEKYNDLYSDFKGFFSVLGNHDIYDTLEMQKQRQHHIIDTPVAKIIMLDTGPYGLGRPLNFFGFIDSIVLEIIEMSLSKKPIIILAHYPLSTTFYSKKLFDLVEKHEFPVYYLCGHLHYFIKPFGYHLKTTYNGLIELEVGDVKEHAASRLFHVNKDGITFSDIYNYNSTSVMILKPTDQKFLLNKANKWDGCVQVRNIGAKRLNLYLDDKLVHEWMDTEDKIYSYCIADVVNAFKLTLKGVGDVTDEHTVYLQHVPVNKLPWQERLTYFLYSLNYADAFIRIFYAFYIFQFFCLFSLLFSKGKLDSHWLSLSAFKYTYTKVWIVFLVTSLAFLVFPIFYGSFAKDNKRCSVIEAPFYPFGTKYNNQDVFQFDFLIWITMFLYYENFAIFLGYHIYLFRHKIQYKWIPMLYPALICYMKYRLLWNMFTWYVYEDSSCFDSESMYVMWNLFGFVQLLVMPVSWIFVRYMHLLATNKLSFGFRPKDL